MALYQKLIRLGAPSRGMFWATLLVYLVLLVVLLVILVPRKATFSAEVLSEQFEVEVPPLALLPFRNGVTLESFDAPAGASCAHPSLRFDGDAAPGVNQSGSALTFVVTAVGAESFAVKVTSAQGADSGMHVSCDGGSDYPAPREVQFTVTQSGFLGKTYRFDGAITLGGGSLVREDDTLPILKEGAVRVVARAFPFGSGTASESNALTAADTVRFFDSSNARQPAEGSLIARYEPGERAFRIVAHVVARQAEVYRIGSQRSELMVMAPTIWTRIQAQREWAILLVILAVLARLLETCRKQYEVEQEK